MHLFDQGFHMIYFLNWLIVMVMTMIIMIMIMIMMMTLIGGGVGDHTNELILLAYHMINFSTLWLVGVTIKMRLWTEDII